MAPRFSANWRYKGLDGVSSMEANEIWGLEEIVGLLGDWGCEFRGGFVGEWGCEIREG